MTPSPWPEGCGSPHAPLSPGQSFFFLVTGALPPPIFQPPELALRLPPRLLAGLGFILVNPFSLIPITLILTVSRFLLPRLRRVSFMAVAVVGIAFVLVGAFWVRNPIALWRISIMGNERTFPNLIGELFTFHIIPAPKISYDSTAAFESSFGGKSWNAERDSAS